MLTWKLWRGLRQPPFKHPLYQEVIGRPAAPMAASLGCVVVLIAPFVLLPALLFLSTAYGLRWAMQIASTIARDHETRRYELVALSPEGAFGVSRAIMSAYVQRNESLAQIQTVGAWVLRLAFMLTIMLALTSLSTPILTTDYAPNVNEIITVLYLVTMAVAIYIDHVHSVLVGLLVGMWIPVVVPRRLDASMGALLVYLLLQVTAYLVVVLGCFTLLPALLGSIPRPYNTVLLALLRVVVLFAVREILIRWLWATVVRQTNATPSELEFMTR